ncbi:MAG: ComEA family DNA-binding protein, partial [Clostridium sp.]
LININTASAEELKTLNGIGDSKAEAIISYREEKGGFKNIEEIQNVSGIGKATFEKLKDKICV